MTYMTVVYLVLYISGGGISHPIKVGKAIHSADICEVLANRVNNQKLSVQAFCTGGLVNIESD